MSILCYAEGKNEITETLHRMIEQDFPDVEKEYYSRLDAIKGRLLQPKNGLEISILLVTNRDILCQLISLKSLLTDMKVLLILPERDMDTIRIAHRMLPNYIGFFDDGWTEFSQVLKKISQNRKNGYGQEMRKQQTVSNYI